MSVIVLGCGTNGTTIVADCVAATHPGWAYIYEPLLWQDRAASKISEQGLAQHLHVPLRCTESWPWIGKLLGREDVLVKTIRCGGRILSLLKHASSRDKFIVVVRRPQAFIASMQQKIGWHHQPYVDGAPIYDDRARVAAWTGLPLDSSREVIEAAWWRLCYEDIINVLLSSRREQFLVVVLENLQKAPLEQLGRIASFLGMPTAGLEHLALQVKETRQGVPVVQEGKLLGQITASVENFFYGGAQSWQ